MTIVKPIEIVVLQKYHTFIIESHPGCGVWQNRSDKILKCIETVICVYLFIYGFVYYAVCECDFFLLCCVWRWWLGCCRWRWRQHPNQYVLHWIPISHQWYTVITVSTSVTTIIFSSQYHYHWTPPLSPTSPDARQARTRFIPWLNYIMFIIVYLFRFIFIVFICLCFTLFSQKKKEKPTCEFNFTEFRLFCVKIIYGPYYLLLLPTEGSFIFYSKYRVAESRLPVPWTTAGPPLSTDLLWDPVETIYLLPRSKFTER